MTLHRPDPEPTIEESEEALLAGDVPLSKRSGTARAAFAHRDFRRMWIGSFLSQIGTWMQQVVLASYAYKLTGSGAFVGLIAFAQLGPLLLLSLVGGMIADIVDRRRLLIILQAAQGVFSLALAGLVAASDNPSLYGIIACVLGIGIANAINAPTWSATLPGLVGREDLPGAISLNSTMVNGSRVVGPAVGGLLYPIVGAAWVFVINAATYLFVIAALVTMTLPEVPKAAEKGWAKLVAGFRVARQVPIVGRILILLPIFSFFCLPFIGLFVAIAETDLGLNSKSLTYGLLYATFGLGAAVGSLSIGTVLAPMDKRRLVRVGLVTFALAMGTYAFMRHPAPAFVVVFVLGAAYFGTTTSMMTVLQATLDDQVRGRVMALWFMGFGGTVPLGALVFGPLLDAFHDSANPALGGTIVLLMGAVVALVMAWFGDLTRAGRGNVELAVAS